MEMIYRMNALISSGDQSIHALKSDIKILFQDHGNPVFIV